MGGTVSPRRRPGRRRTKAEREAAVADWRQLGTSAAARKHGISEETLRKWRHAQGAFDVGTAAVGEMGPEDPALEPTPVAAEGRVPVVHGRGHRYGPSEKAAAVQIALADGVSEAVRQTGASRFMVYQWLGKAARQAGEAEPEGRAATDVERQRDLEVLHEWHKQPGLGPSQIRNQLRRRGIHTSVHTVRRVMEEKGYRPPKVKSQAHHGRYEAVRPGQLWHMDFLHRHIHQAPTFTLVLLDDYSRFAVGHAVDDAERADAVITAFEEAVAKHGRPEAVMSDRGSAFWSWRGVSRFTRLLDELGVDQYIAEDKELNGKSEKFNADLAKEFFNVKEYADVASMRQALAAHLRWYNHGRTHGALGGMLVPADRFYGRVDEVMELLESGATPDVHNLSLAARGLDLFKVTSSGGKPEVWLLGQRIF
jgi:transposase InsO family protein